MITRFFGFATTLRQAQGPVSSLRMTSSKENLKYKIMRIGFMGTPNFAVPALKKLIEQFEVIVVYSREPKPVGRGHKVAKTPVHLIAEENGIEVRTPKSVKKNVEEWDYLKSLDLDYIVVCAYGLILPQELLDIPSKGCINIHGSLLPRWRGAAPLQRAIMAGDKYTGITIMQMDAGLDTGDMLLKGELEIEPTTTASELHDAMAELGAELIVEYLTVPTKPEKQDDSLATYANKISKEEGLITWGDSAEKIIRQFNALSIWPGVYFLYNGEEIKVKELELIHLPTSPSPLAGEGRGEGYNQNTPHQNDKIVLTPPQGGSISFLAGTILSEDMTIACGEGAIKLNKIQKPGKSPVKAEDFFNGEHHLNVGDILK